MHRVLRAAKFAWGPKAAYEVTFLGCTSRFVRMNRYDVESSVQPPYKVSFTGEAFPPLAQVVLGLVFKIPCFRDSQCMYTPRYSFWYESGVQGYVPVVSPSCRAVSPMLLDVHVLWRHNCRLSLCCDAPLLGNGPVTVWTGWAWHFVKCRRWCHCRLYFCVLPCLTRTMYGFETYSELKQASRMGGCEEVPTPVR